MALTETISQNTEVKDRWIRDFAGGIGVLPLLPWGRLMYTVDSVLAERPDNWAGFTRSLCSKDQLIYVLDHMNTGHRIHHVKVRGLTPTPTTSLEADDKAVKNISGSTIQTIWMNTAPAVVESIHDFAVMRGNQSYPELRARELEAPQVIKNLEQFFQQPERTRDVSALTETVRKIRKSLTDKSTELGMLQLIFRYGLETPGTREMLEKRIEGYMSQLGMDASFMALLNLRVTPEALRRKFQQPFSKAVYNISQECNPDVQPIDWITAR